jgi:hypothetical protein
MAQDGRIDPNKHPRPEDHAEVKDGVSGNTAGAVTPKDETRASQGVAAPRQGAQSDVVKEKGA